MSMLLQHGIVIRTLKFDLIVVVVVVVIIIIVVIVVVDDDVIVIIIIFIIVVVVDVVVVIIINSSSSIKTMCSFGIGCLQQSDKRTDRYIIIYIYTTR